MAGKPEPILANFDLTNLIDVVSDANKRFAENESRSFRRTTSNWSEKPTFNVKVTNIGYGGVKEYEVSTNSKKYKWVDEGTEAHTIVPKTAKALNIKGGGAYSVGEKAYNAKTKVGKLVSNGAGNYYPKDIKSLGVVQSIEARGFTEKIKEFAPKRWSNALESELKKYIDRNVF